MKTDLGRAVARLAGWPSAMVSHRYLRAKIKFPFRRLNGIRAELGSRTQNYSDLGRKLNADQTGRRWDI